MIFIALVLLLISYVIIGTIKEYNLRKQIKKTDFYKEWKMKKN